jgi:hypothetical protein
MAAVKSAVEATAYLSNTERVFQPQIFIMLVSGTPALIRLRAGKFVYAKPQWVYFSMAVLFGAILPGVALLLGALSFAKASRVPYSSLDNIGAPFQIDSAQHGPNSSAVGDQSPYTHNPGSGCNRLATKTIARVVRKISGPTFSNLFRLSSGCTRLIFPNRTRTNVPLVCNFKACVLRRSSSRTVVAVWANCGQSL